MFGASNVESLRTFGVNTEYIDVSDKEQTGCSTVIVTKDGKVCRINVPFYIPFPVIKLLILRFLLLNSAQEIIIVKFPSFQSSFFYDLFSKFEVKIR